MWGAIPAEKFRLEAILGENRNYLEKYWTNIPPWGVKLKALLKTL